MPDFNLLPGRRGTPKLGRRTRGIVLILALGILEIVGCFYLYKDVTKKITETQQTRQTLDQEVATLEKELEAVVAETAALPPLEEIEQAKPKVPPRPSPAQPTKAEIPTIMIIPSLLPFLEQLPSATPVGAWIHRLEEKDGICLIEGYAFQANDVSSLLTAIKGLPGVIRTNLVETKQELFPNRKIPLQHFTLELSLGGA